MYTQKPKGLSWPTRLHCTPCCSASNSLQKPRCIRACISLVCQQSHIAHLQALGDLVLQIPSHAIATFSRVVLPSLSTDRRHASIPTLPNTTGAWISHLDPWSGIASRTIRPCRPFNSVQVQPQKRHRKKKEKNCACTMEDTMDEIPYRTVLQWRKTGAGWLRVQSRAAPLHEESWIRR